MSFKRRAGSSPALGTEKASPNSGEAFFVWRECPEQGKSGQHLISQFYQSHNTEIIHFHHCEIKIIRIFVISLLVKQHCWESKAGIYPLNGYLPFPFKKDWSQPCLSERPLYSIPSFDIAFSMTKDIGNPMPLPCLIVAHQGQIHWIISSFADSRHQVSNILLYLHWTRARARIQGHIFNESVFTLSLLEIWQFQMRKDNDDYALTLYSDIRCTPHQSRYGCGVWYRLFSHGFCQNL